MDFFWERISTLERIALVTNIRLNWLEEDTRKIQSTMANHQLIIKSWPQNLWALDSSEKWVLLKDTPEFRKKVTDWALRGEIHL